MKKKNYNKPSTSTAEQRRNKIYAIILACAMVFWTIASLLGMFAFARTLTGSAETATVREVERKTIRAGERFQEVDLHTGGITWVYDNDPSLNPCFTLFNTSIRFYENGGVELVLGGYEYYQDYVGEPYNFYVPALFNMLSVGQNNVIAFNLNQWEYAVVTYNPIFQFEQPYGGDYRGSYVRTVNCSADIFRRLDGSSFLSYDYEFLWYDLDGVYLGSDTLSLSVEDYFLYGDYITIVYPYSGTLYTVSTSATVSCGSWSTNYAYYFDNGYNVGEFDGFNTGYDEGYDLGNREGYAEGFQQGVEDAGNYTFFALISAVVDAPIQAFTGLFNFDLLGINLADFFFSVLTVAVIIAVIRLFL